MDNNTTLTDDDRAEIDAIIEGTFPRRKWGLLKAALAVGMVNCRTGDQLHGFMRAFEPLPPARHQERCEAWLDQRKNLLKTRIARFNARQPVRFQDRSCY